MEDFKENCRQLGEKCFEGGDPAKDRAVAGTDSRLFGSNPVRIA